MARSKVDIQISRNNSYQYLINEHMECVSRAKTIAKTAEENFKRPAYKGTIAEVGRNRRTIEEEAAVQRGFQEYLDEELEKYKGE